MSPPAIGSYPGSTRAVETAVSRTTISSPDLDRLRDIVDTANDTAGGSAVDVTFAVLDRVRDAIGADWATFQDTRGAARRIQHLQCAMPDGYLIAGPEDLDEGPDDPFWRFYPSSVCSLPDRVGGPMVFSLLEVYSEREWARHPMHTEALTVVQDEILAAWPSGAGTNRRLIVARTEGPPFTDVDRFLVQLLQPHLQPLFVRTVHSVAPPAEPPLTERQRQVLALVRTGMTNQQVARRLGISSGTVRKHLENSYSRLQVQSRVAAVGVAFSHGDDGVQQA